MDIRTFGTHYKGREVEIVSIADVTDKHIAFEALSRQELLLNSIMNSTDDLIWAVDDRKHYTAFNNAFRDGIRMFKNQDVHVGGPLVKGDTEEEINRWNEYYERSLAGEAHMIEESIELEDVGLAFSRLPSTPSGSTSA